MNSFKEVARHLVETLEQVQSPLRAISEAEAGKRPRPGKWSKKEILGHLMDSASNNHQRFVRAAIDRKLTFPGYPQDALVELQRFNELEWGKLVELWTGYNRFLAHIIAVLPQDAAEVTCLIGEHPPASLAWIAEDYVEHMKHHLNQILGTRFESAYQAGV